MVEATLEDGTTGIGTSIGASCLCARDPFVANIATGGDPACFIIEKHLSRFVEGQVRGTLTAFLQLTHARTLATWS